MEIFLRSGEYMGVRLKEKRFQLLILIPLRRTWGIIMKKLFFCVLTGCIVLMLAACGGKGNGGSTASSKEYVYKAEEVPIEKEETSRVNDFYMKDGRMYFFSTCWLEEGSQVVVMNSKMDGSDAKSFTIDMKRDSYFSYWNSDEEGNYYAVYDEYLEEGAGEEVYYRDDYYLVKMDSGGKEIWKLPLNSENQDYWVKWMHLLPDGRIGVADQGGISFYDTDGKPAGHVTPSEDLDGGTYFLQDGTVVVGTYNDTTSQSVLRKLDVNTGEYSGEYVIPGGSGNYSLYAGADCDFLLVGNGGVYSYNLGDEEIEKRMDFIDSDLSTTYIYELYAVSKEEFYGMMDDEMTGEEVIMKFTKVDPKDVADKAVLTLACNYLNWDVRKHVVEFNKTNPDYRIQITEYARYNTDEDGTIGITRLNTDIASGKMPDILLLDYEMPIESYASKGLFEDLYPYIDKDEELNKEDYFPNIMKAFENNGKLYRLAPRFVINTVAGKTADVGDRENWTIQDLKAVMASKPEGMEVFSEMTRGEMLYYSMRMSGDQFIDWESGKCSFNSEDFLSLLEFIKSFPETLPEDYYDESRGEWNSWFRNGTVLLSQMTLDSFSSYNYTKKGTFGEDITLIGFPSGEGKGSVINSELEIAMSAKSGNKDGAWQFMRYFLTDEYQGAMNYGLPVSIKHAEKLAQEAKKRPSYEDENGNIVEYDDTYYIGGEEIPITPMTQEEVDTVFRFIESVDRLYSGNQELFDIVAEEAAPYFEGQKRAEEVADIIENRVQIYVNENR